MNPHLNILTVLLLHGAVPSDFIVHGLVAQFEDVVENGALAEARGLNHLSQEQLAVQVLQLCKQLPVVCPLAGIGEHEGHDAPNAHGKAHEQQQFGIRSDARSMIPRYEQQQHPLPR